MINALHLKNVGQFENLDAELGTVVLVEGPNGAGKSTLLNTFTAVFENLHDADLIRNGQDKAEITLELADGTIIERTITRKDTYARVKTPDGRKISKVETYLKSLASGITLDPVRFANASKKEKIDKLLEMMPIRFSPEEIAIAGGSRVGSTSYDLTDIDALIAGREDMRTEANRKVRSQEATLATLTQSLPPQTEEKDWDAETTELSRQLSEARTALTSTTTALDREQGELMAGALATKNAKMEEARKRYQSEVDAAEAAFSNFRDTTQSDYEWKRTAATNEAQSGIDSLSSQYTVAKERATAQHRQQGVRDSIEKIRSEIKADALAASAVQEQIDSLRKLRKAKLDQLPVPGLEIRDGDIYFKGKKFDTQLNETERYLLAFQICAVARGKDSLPFFICDHGSAMDNKNLAWLADACKQSGFQLIITRPTREEEQRELTITSV